MNNNQVGSGKYRFDTLIKTMIARIEYNNTLAPVQEYGRHMQRVAKNKKNNKKDEAMQQASDKKVNRDVDERYYDLDDDFIDDGDIQEQAGWEGLLAGEGFIGGDNSDVELEDESALASKSIPPGATTT